jgi:hypothetical protein
MAAPKPQQRGSIIDAKDLRYFIRIASKNWYFVVVALLLSALYCPTCTATSSRHLRGHHPDPVEGPNEVYDYQSQVYKSLGYAGVYGDLVNQKRVLTSYDLVDETLDKLGFRHLLLHRGPVQDLAGLWHPALHGPDGAAQPGALRTPFDLKIVDVDTYELSYDHNGELTRGRFKFDEEVRTCCSSCGYSDHRG